MAENLLKESWIEFDSAELRHLLDHHIGGPGQCDDRSNNPDKLYLPLARSSCRIVLTYRENKIVAIELGQAFDSSEWERVSEEIEKSIHAGPTKVGREYSFSSFRVLGSWRDSRTTLPARTLYNIHRHIDFQLWNILPYVIFVLHHRTQ